MMIADAIHTPRIRNPNGEVYGGRSFLGSGYPLSRRGLSRAVYPAGRRTTGHRCPASRWRPSRHRPGRTRSDQLTGPMFHRAGPVRLDVPSSRLRDGGPAASRDLTPRPLARHPRRRPAAPRTAATANRGHPLSPHGPRRHRRHRHGVPPESGIGLHSAQMDTPVLAFWLSRCQLRLNARLMLSPGRTHWTGAARGIPPRHRRSAS